MNVIRSSLRMMPPMHFKVGTCCVCGEKSFLKFVDPEMPGGFFGDCCLADALSADRVLMAGQFQRPKEGMK